jgi:FkbM family methyltransferase
MSTSVSPAAGGDPTFRLERTRNFEMASPPMNFTKFLRATTRRALPRRLKPAVKGVLLRLFETSGFDCASPLRIGTFKGLRFAYRQGTADESVLKQTFEDDVFFSCVPEYQPSDSDVIVDVGAHIGAFAVLAASKVPRGAVHAIEACQDSFNFLFVNAAINRMANLSVYHLALSDREGDCTLYHDSHNWGHSTVLKMSDRTETVQCRTLQRFFEKADIPRCTLLKMNCEGAEFPILLASPPEVLRRVRMMLVFYHSDLWTTNSREDVVSHLRASSFECKIRHSGEDRGWIVAVNRNWVGV